MPKPVNFTPAYRRHEGGQAIVVLDGRTCYLGPHGTAASRREYDRLVALWLANGRRLPGRPSDDVTVADLILAFWKHAQGYYVSASGHTAELHHYRVALRMLRHLHADSPAAEFGPLALKAVREQMIAAGWTRGHVNAQVKRLVRAFKWGTENELVPGGVLQALQAVSGLREGKTEAPEGKVVVPAPETAVEAVLAVCPPPVATMIRLQQLTGMRPGELCQMRRGDVDTTDPALWVYTPATHKTQHVGHERAVYLGERCQAVLAPFMGRGADAHLFSPAEALAWTRAHRTTNRKTPASCGNVVGSHLRAKGRRSRWSPDDRYTTASYGRAIKYACDRAFVPPPPLGPTAGESSKAWYRRLSAEQLAELKVWRVAHRWHPHQLRHNAATRFRREHGLEAAQVLLGHKTLAVTQVYAQRNVEAAKSVMGREG